MDNIEMPDVSPFDHVAEWFSELGYMMDRQPLSFQEIQSWSAVTGTILSAWHGSVLRQMSVAYVGQMFKFRKRYDPAPYMKDTRTMEQIRADVVRKIKASR